MTRLAILFLLTGLFAVNVVALNNGLGIKPQMGWNSWNHFHCNLQEGLIRSTAEVLISTGLAKVGYIYVNLDDCWAVSRDNSSRVVPDPKGFPSGMFKLGEYIHSLNLKFGIYSDAGNKTCAGRPGSLGHEYDNCNANTDPKLRYPPMRDALNATGRPIFFSMCEWGQEDPATWAAPIGNSWRTTGDISDRFSSMTSNLDQNDRWWNYSGPGGWNDPDMLEVGNGGMTNDEYISHFSLWCLVKSPLLIGCDLTNTTAETLMILTNTEVIALNQDDLGVQGHRLTPSGDTEVWGGPLANGDAAIILFNRGSSSANISITWTIDLGMNPDTTVAIRDLWVHKDLGLFTNAYSAVVASHATQTLRLTPQSKDGTRVNNIWEQYQRHPNMKNILHPSTHQIHTLSA